MNSRCPMKPSRPVSIQPDRTMTVNTDGMSAEAIAQAVAARKISALEVTEAALARIAKHDEVLNSFTDVTADRARAKARAVDAAIAAGQKVGPLVGVPFAVKNLFARSTGDLALAYDAMQGPDADDAACTTRSVEPVAPLLTQDISGLRVAIAGGYFQNNVFPEAVEAMARVAKALNATRTVEIPEAARARAPAYVISTTEGASLHLDRLP